MPDDEVDDVAVEFTCERCGRSLGERLYSTPIYSEDERIQSGSSALDTLNLFLPDRDGNANQDYPPSRGASISNPLGIAGMKGPRTGGRVWRADIRDGSVIVHFSCRCRRPPRRLAEIVEEAQKTINQDGRSGPRVRI